MKNWKKLQERFVYRGYRNIIRKTFEMPDERVLDYDVFDSASFVNIAAVTKERKILLIKQYRPGPEKICLGFPAGYIDEDETIVEAAQRELLEETGYTTNQIYPVKTIQDAYSTIRQYCLIAINCEQVAQPKYDENEFLEMIEMTIGEFKEMLVDEKNTAFESIGLGFLLLHYLGE